ncbi:hypothetical protein B296_00031381 [Ensete ventricosum]|uniref:DUF4283 domain-containing protein n=1 Tax=Ensete ventricosum TaxID=4639 RepID=A0A426XSQ4_ENSVE|nr:hypothetical protein B296_00031381 [Ensete ventricosum]
MILRRWAPNVRLELDSLQSIPIWVSFHIVRVWAKSSFDRFFMHRLKNLKFKSFPTYLPVEFRSFFRVPSQKFEKLAIPDVLAHGKPYEHGFTKKHDSHKLCA